MTTSFREAVAVENISDRAYAYDMPGALVDGQDAMAMYEATTEAVRRARAGEGPTLIEARTYRARSMTHLSVTFDHRALDGVPVAEFMRTLKSRLESPGTLVGES